MQTDTTLHTTDLLGWFLKAASSGACRGRQISETERWARSVVLVCDVSGLVSGGEVTRGSSGVVVFNSE